MIIDDTPWHYPYYTKDFTARVMQKCLLGDYEEAIQICDNAIELNPDDGIAYGRRANVKNQLSDYRGAVQDCNKAIGIWECDAYAYFTRGIG